MIGTPFPCSRSAALVADHAIDVNVENGDARKFPVYYAQGVLQASVGADPASHLLQSIRCGKIDQNIVLQQENARAFEYSPSHVRLNRARKDLRHRTNIAQRTVG